MKEYDVFCQFDLSKHRCSMKTFNYLEVIIYPDGRIAYAVPSHQEKLKAICIEATSREEFEERLKSPEAWADYIQWLCNYSGCVSVWVNFCIKPKDITPAQLQTLKVLSETSYEVAPDLKLYRGEF